MKWLFFFRRNKKLEFDKILSTNRDLVLHCETLFQLKPNQTSSFCVGLVDIRATLEQKV